jgi:hypothetical protein
VRPGRGRIDIEGFDADFSSQLVVVVVVVLVQSIVPSDFSLHVSDWLHFWHVYFLPSIVLSNFAPQLPVPCMGWALATTGAKVTIARAPHTVTS